MGRPFAEVFAHSLNWLSNEGYVRSAGSLAYEKVTLTTKGLAALNAVPQGPSATIGSTLATTRRIAVATTQGYRVGNLPVDENREYRSSALHCHMGVTRFTQSRVGLSDPTCELR
jgi:hypothetical protein